MHRNPQAHESRACRAFHGVRRAGADQRMPDSRGAGRHGGCEMNVELIYDADCPNVTQTRSLLIRAFTQTGVSARWREWDRSAPESPEYVRSYGSPTILIDGGDLAGVAPGAETRSCRLYND